MKQAMTNEPYMSVPTPQMRSRMRTVRTCESHTSGGRSRTVTRVNVIQDSCGALTDANHLPSTHTHLAA
jgi:hypothetical protein